MDPDSKLAALVRTGSLVLAAGIVLASAILVGLGKLDGKDFIALVGQAGTIAGAGRMMTLPSATTSTKETDPTTGKTTETKTQQPLGMPAPTVTASPAPSPVPASEVTIVNKDPVPVKETP